MVPASPIFSYVSASDPTSQSHDSSEESMTPKGIPNPHYKPPNPVPCVPYDPDLEPSWSDYSLSESSDSLDDNYYKWR